MTKPWPRSLSISPLVERELLAGGRRKSFFWLRGVLALVAGFQAYEALNGYLTPSGVLVAGASGAALLRQMAGLLFMASLMMGLWAADSINRERRDGTLGLLLLTGLTPHQIVRGKMLSCGVTSFLVLLGALPALMFPVLVGGMRGSEAMIIGLGVLNALFVSLAAGLWMSSVFRNRLYVLPSTIALVGALAFGAELFGAAFSGAAAVPYFRWLGLGGWITATHLPQPFAPVFLDPVMAPRFRLLGLGGWITATPTPPVFIVWLCLSHAAGWVILRLAAFSLARNWRDEPLQHYRQPAPPEPWTVPALPSITPTVPEAAPTVGDALPLPNPRPWDADPIQWRMGQLGSPQGIIWLAVLADFTAQFGALGPYATSWGLLSFGGMLVTVISSGVLAWVGARFFQHSARQQDLELLLTTPVGAANILSGQRRVLWQSLRWPLCVPLALAVPAGICLLLDATAGRSSSATDLLPPFLVAVNLVVEVLALCWVGMRFGLGARNPASAVLWTIGLVQLFPMALVVAANIGWAALATPLAAVSAHPRTSVVVPGLLLFLAKNVGFAIWAPIQLRRDLRLKTRVRTPDRQVRRFVPQHG